VIVSVISIAVNLALNLVLVRVMGHEGLALGTALAAIFNAATLLWLLRGKLGGLDGRELATVTLKVAIASAIMGATAYYAAGWLTTLTPGGGEIAKGVRVFGAIALALVALAASAKLLRIEEFDAAAARVLKRIRR